MQRFTSAALAVLLALVPVFASAQEKAKAPTIAVVDMEKLLENSTAGQSIQKQVETERAAFAAEQKSYEEDLRKQAAELQRQQSIMAPDVMKAERQKFDQRATAINQQLTERGQVLEKSFNDGLNTVIAATREIVQQLAKERGIELVLSRRQIMLLTDLSLDITDPVMQRLNQKLPSVTVTIPKPGTPEAAAALAAAKGASATPTAAAATPGTPATAPRR